MNAIDVIIAGTALYGAVLSTYVIVNQRKESQRQIQVTLQTTIVKNVPRVNPQKIYFSLIAANTGAVPVTLGGHGILLPGKLTATSPNPFSTVSFPYELDPGKSCHVFMEIRATLERLKNEGHVGTVKLIPFYRDQTSKTYKGKPLKVPVSTWLSRKDM